MGTWHNADGLYVKLGVDEGTPSKGGEVHNGANSYVWEADIDLSILAVASSTVLSDTSFLPQGARIEAVEVITLTVADSASDTAVLNVGTIDADTRTSGDPDGLVLSAAQTTIDAAGERMYLTTGGDAGALIGTTLDENQLVVADADTEVFTAGRVKIRIFYFFP